MFYVCFYIERKWIVKKFTMLRVLLQYSRIWTFSIISQSFGELLDIYNYVFCLLNKITLWECLMNLYESLVMFCRYYFRMWNIKPNRTLPCNIVERGREREREKKWGKEKEIINFALKLHSMFIHEKICFANNLFIYPVPRIAKAYISTR